ncbi:unnamed protein product [Meganyctiphanes norvegica]|uniref:Prolactin receptor n=1 Tax=Meganyctiphanes norvegica TaxID=48144 RepID=A0AAV2QL10_MEGNR
MWSYHKNKNMLTLSTCPDTPPPPVPGREKKCPPLIDYWEGSSYGHLQIMDIIHDDDGSNFTRNAGLGGGLHAKHELNKIFRKTSTECCIGKQYQHPKHGALMHSKEAAPFKHAIAAPDSPKSPSFLHDKWSPGAKVPRSNLFSFCNKEISNGRNSPLALTRTPVIDMEEGLEYTENMCIDLLPSIKHLRDSGTLRKSTEDIIEVIV